MAKVLAPQREAVLLSTAAVPFSPQRSFGAASALATAPVSGGSAGDEVEAQSSGGATSPSAWQGATTAMLRNIPNRYTQSQLLEEIGDMGFAATYDFFYLPLDQLNRSNMGYAFINFLTPVHLMRFAEIFNGYAFRRYPSQKIAKVVPAHIQGFEGNVRHFSNRMQSSTTQPTRGQYSAEGMQCKPLVLRHGRNIDLCEALAELELQCSQPDAIGMGSLANLFEAPTRRQGSAAAGPLERPPGLGGVEAEEDTKLALPPWTAVNDSAKVEAFLPQELPFVDIALGELDEIALSLLVAAAEAQADCQGPSSQPDEGLNTYNMGHLPNNPYQYDPIQAAAMAWAHRRSQAKEPQRVEITPIGLQEEPDDDKMDTDKELLSAAKVEFERMLAGMLADSSLGKSKMERVASQQPESPASSTEADSAAEGCGSPPSTPDICGNSETTQDPLRVKPSASLSPVATRQAPRSSMPAKIKLDDEAVLKSLFGSPEAPPPLPEFPEAACAR